MKAVAAIILCCLPAVASASNFLVVAYNDAEVAAEVAKTAEYWRSKHSQEWFGRSMPAWSQPCPIRLTTGENVGAGGATTFSFGDGSVGNFRMEIQGSRNRLIDSVVPHEVLHTVFATHLSEAVPRWADEGACVSVEHFSVRDAARRRVVSLLANRQLRWVGELFRMTEYPADVMTLYDQGYSICQFLLHLGGKREYVAFLSDAIRSGDWESAVRQRYGHDRLVDLQEDWVSWIKAGHPAPKPEMLQEVAYQISDCQNCLQWDRPSGKFRRRTSPAPANPSQPPVIVKPPVVVEEPEPQPPTKKPDLPANPPSKPCQCDGSGDCKCDLSKVGCKCDPFKAACECKAEDACKCDADLIKKLEARIVLLESRKPEKGDPGKAGPAGPPGKAADSAVTKETIEKTIRSKLGVLVSNKTRGTRFVAIGVCAVGLVAAALLWRS